MANAGLVVYGDSGVLQIDSTYRNLGFRAKGTLVTDTSYSGVSATYGTIVLPSSYANPIVAVGGSIPAQVDTYRSGSQVGFAISADGPIGTSIPYYVFDQVPQDPSAHGAGLQVWSASGALLFDTTYPPMRVVAFLNSPIGDSLSFTGVSGRTYAVAFCATGLEVDTRARLTAQATFSKVSGASVTPVAVDVATIPASPIQLLIKRAIFMVLDVTNL